MKICPGQEENCFKAKKNLSRNMYMCIFKKDEHTMPIILFDAMN